MKLKLTLMLIVLFGLKSFGQTTPHRDTEREVCIKAMQAMDSLVTFVKKSSLRASGNAIILLDTTQSLLNGLDKDNVAISSDDFIQLVEVIESLKKHDYSKLLVTEKKAPKVKVTIDNRTYMWSKNTFMPLYTMVSLSKDLFKDWYQKL